MTRAQEALWTVILIATVLGIPVLCYAIGAGVTLA